MVNRGTFRSGWLTWHATARVLYDRDVNIRRAAYFACVIGGFGPSLNKQIGNQTRTQRLCVVVRRMMQDNAVPFGLLEAIATHIIKGNRELLHRFMQGLCLFWYGLQSHSYRSAHDRMIPYMLQFWQKAEMTLLPKPQGRPASSPCLKDRGTRRSACDGMRSVASLTGG